jgi:hypothetical protein
MVNYKCSNCGWEGEEPCKHLEPRFDGKCPVCFDEVKEVDAKPEVKNEKSVIDERVEDFVDDLKDDGKRNYSNRKRKKKGGRK